MPQRIGLMVGLSFIVGGCMQPSMSMDPPKKPTPSPEMKKFEYMVGTWADTSELVSPTKDEMMKHMPPGSKEPPTNFKGGGKTEWAMGGMALKHEGWMEMGEGLKGNYLEYWTWDPKVKKYRSWFLTDWGETGTGWVTPCDDCDGFCMKSQGVDAQGNKQRMEGCMRRVDQDTHDWNFTLRGPMGKMSMKGTSKRQK